MRRALLPLALSFATLAFAADQPVPVVKEPYHKVVFENPYVRVIDVSIAPGVITRYHVHDIASVVVYLTKSSNVSQSWGKTSKTPRNTTPADSRYAPYDEQSLTHQVTNTGNNVFHVYDLELLRSKPAAGAYPLKATPAIVPRWEQKQVRSLNVYVDPAARVEIPASECAHLFINVNTAVMTRELAGAGKSRTLKAASYAFFPPKTGFAISNSGREKAECVLLELK